MPYDSTIRITQAWSLLGRLVMSGDSKAALPPATDEELEETRVLRKDWSPKDDHPWRHRRAKEEPNNEQDHPDYDR